VSQPTPYVRQADFSDHSTNFPSVPHVGVDLDDEFNAVKVTLDQTLANLALIQRDDGQVANLTIGASQLKAELLALLAGSTVWTTAVTYAVGAVVFINNAIYQCLTAHTSGTFAADLAAAKWATLVDFGGTYFTGTSTTSSALATGSKTFTTQADKGFSVGTFVLIVSNANPSTNYFYGQITAYSGTSLTVNVEVIGGSGCFEVTVYNDVFITGSCYKDVGNLCSVIHFHHLKSFHCGLKSTDRIDFGNNYTGTSRSQ